MVGGNAMDPLKDCVEKLEQLVVTFPNLNELVSNIAMCIDMVEKSIMEHGVDWETQMANCTSDLAFLTDIFKNNLQAMADNIAVVKMVVQIAPT